MMQDLEILDIVDENDCIIGQKPRSEIYSQGLCNFRVVNAFVINSLRQLWIPRRSSKKRIFPLCLDVSMGGHVESKESYEDALQRELKEELNLELDNVDFRLLGYLKPHQHHVSAFMKVYEIKLDDNPDYNKNDFVESFWLSPSNLIEWLNKGEPAKSDLIKLVQMFYAN
ncbi:NUDIX domain-containing protein [Nostoc sp. FACHB-87]|uniref:NUDIX hydrolase n=1 Tax=Nostocaceae TaxID=1162 RepID=UPI001685814B|nr:MULTISPECIES: NUDIX domain-containing protein [Nostocaceae]MBD2302985.1 NUDIX domain-containing protein [Nostoc sp. FACHB-190]MBD2458823.1 NUDIX domain-containing protein [Nostoc sp. FACHB-87]MBD2479872.1 NUDIX domain-containing protein [Anabaena sp. FACHB-83]